MSSLTDRLIVTRAADVLRRVSRLLHPVDPAVVAHVYTERGVAARVIAVPDSIPPRLARRLDYQSPAMRPADVQYALQRAKDENVYSL